MQDQFAAYCQCYTDQELASVHVIHWAQDPTPFVNTHHAHLTVPHGPCGPSLIRQQVLIWQGKSAGNVHADATVAKTTGILLQLPVSLLTCLRHL